ncbi:hypothetical protein BGP_0351 [Beggiatoa sp. PS]|nr:hypothetical protein BGP_0351 [Beggiatoa sp. PS]
MFVFSVCVNAQEFNEPPYEEVIDYAISPELIADSIVIFLPEMDMPLHILETKERIIEGKVTEVEKGVEPNLIIQNANTMIMPLKEGVPVKLFLKRHPDKEAYYPIAIFPVTYEVTESLEDFQASENSPTDFAENATGLWQDTNNEEAYYSFHQNGNTIIIIDLLRLESSGNKFSATYMGSVEDEALNPMLPGLPISVTFQSDKEATITPICSICSTVIIKLKKVF